MLNVTFKSVGAGDSIIITLNDGLEKIGIIDCKKHNGGNPILDHIIREGVKKIDFIVLSHPHQDHYSGFYQLLDYFEQQNLTIQLFMFSSTKHRAILESIVSAIERRTLAKLYKKVKELADKNIIKNRNITAHGHKIALSDKYFLRILSPSLDEHDDYDKTLYDKDLKVKITSNPNILSTVISIENEDNYVLFTSDAEKKTLRRVGLSHLSKKFSKKLNLGQIPHHGSIKNHKKDFWVTKHYEKNTPLAISVGENSDNHPSQTVIDELNSIDYKIESTWKKVSSSSKRSSILRTHSSTVKTSSGATDNDLIYQGII